MSNNKRSNAGKIVKFSLSKAKRTDDWDFIEQCRFYDCDRLPSEVQDSCFIFEEIEKYMYPENDGNIYIIA